MPAPQARRTRVGRQSSGRWGSHGWIALAVTVAASLTAWAVLFALRDAEPPSLPTIAPPHLDAAFQRTDWTERHLSRTVYPFSVVPGGVYTPEEVATAIDQDPAVARHYDGIALAAMRVMEVDGPRQAYMSYRIGDQIFWTKHRLPLHPGERILTDGDAAIRARCGNRLSDVPMTPTSDAEPSAEGFEGGATPQLAPPPDLLASITAPFAPNESLMPTVDGMLALGKAPFGPTGGGIPAGGFTGGVPSGGGIGGGGTFTDGLAPSGPHTDGNGTPPFVFVVAPVDGGTAPGSIGDGPQVTPEIPGPGTGPTDVDSGGGPPGPPGPNIVIPPHGPGPGGEIPPPAVVPEPTTLSLFGTGLLCVARRCRRQRGKSNAGTQIRDLPN